MKGRKRHIVVDTLGLILSCVVHPADIQPNPLGLRGATQGHLTKLSTKSGQDQRRLLARKGSVYRLSHVGVPTLGRPLGIQTRKTAFLNGLSGAPQ